MGSHPLENTYSLIDVPVRLYKRIKVNRKTACWVWSGGLGEGGYAVGFWRGKHQVIHRLLYELLVGPIPEGLELDHLCRIRPCVNPDHLEPVTREENNYRAVFYTVPKPRKDRILLDLKRVMKTGRMSSRDICAALADRWPERYEGWGPTQLSTALTPLGVRPRAMRIATADGTKHSRRGVYRDDVLVAVAGWSDDAVATG